MNSLVLVVLLAAPTPAASRPKSNLPATAAVFVVPGAGGARAEAGRIEDSLLRALKEAKVPVADADALFPPPLPENTGEARYKEGNEAYDNLDLEGAENKFKEALAFFIDYPELATSQKLALTHAFLGAIALQKGGKQAKKRAEEELARAVVYRPDLELDAKFFGPDVKKVLEKAKAEVGNRPKAVMSFKTEPTGTEVTVQGESQGGTPVPDKEGLPSGRHLVLFHHPGYVPAGLLVDVSGATAEAKATLTPVEKYAAALKEAEGLATAANLTATVAPAGALGLARTMKARFLVIVPVPDDSGSATLQVWDMDSGGKLKDVTLDAPASFGTAAAAVKRWMANPAPAVTSEGPMAVAEPGKSDSVLNKWWFWAAVGGVVVVGATTGVVAGVASAQPHHTFSPVLGF